MQKAIIKNEKPLIINALGTMISENNFRIFDKNMFFISINKITF